VLKKFGLLWFVFCGGLALLAGPAQTSAGSSTLDVTVTDPTGAVIPGATVKVSNTVTGYSKTATTDANGVAHITSIPQHNYHVEVTAGGFQTVAQDVVLRSALPVSITVPMQVASETTSVEVHSDTNDIVESVPMAQTDIDTSLISRLPMQSVGQGVTDVLSLSVPGIVKDSDGFIHPLGDHAETQYSYDNQPVTNQQNK
jgi:hypothetical protein